MKISEAHPSPPQSRCNSFRLRLQSELAERWAGNPQYSLRSFALHLDIDPDGAAGFYKELFGWNVDTANGLNYRMVDTQSDGKG